LNASGVSGLIGRIKKLESERAPSKVEFYLFDQRTSPADKESRRLEARQRVGNSKNVQIIGIDIG